MALPDLREGPLSAEVAPFGRGKDHVGAALEIRPTPVKCLESSSLRCRASWSICLNDLIGDLIDRIVRRTVSAASIHSALVGRCEPHHSLANGRELRSEGTNAPECH